MEVQDTFRETDYRCQGCADDRRHRGPFGNIQAVSHVGADVEEKKDKLGFGRRVPSCSRFNLYCNLSCVDAVAVLLVSSNFCSDFLCTGCMSSSMGFYQSPSLSQARALLNISDSHLRH